MIVTECICKSVNVHNRRVSINLNHNKRYSYFWFTRLNPRNNDYHMRLTPALSLIHI